MNSWDVIFVACSYIVIYFMMQHEERKHRQELLRMNDACNEEIKLVREEARIEREELLDRIMSNNIQEYKVMTQQKENKRSESGNFLVDRMSASLRKQFIDE